MAAAASSVTDLLETGASFLEAARHEHMARTVVYSRGDASVSIRATIGRSYFDLDDHRGSVIRSESRDYIVRSEDLTISGEPAVPQVGDRITDVVDGTPLIYEVFAPGPSGGGEPHYRYTDNYRISIRIHTKHIGGPAE